MANFNFKTLFCNYTLLLAIATTCYSQTRSCGSDAYWAKMKNLHRNDANKTGLRLEETQQGPVTVPVVVHVLYTKDIENVSDAQINSQIVALNRDYRRSNPDSTKTPQIFKSIAADCQIQFTLAKQDPNGFPTTGITRTKTTTSTFSIMTSNAKSTSLGGIDGWDPKLYLNIWVVPTLTDGSSSTILGHSSFPGEDPKIDGLTIGYKYFGTLGTAASPYNMGRTATHEIGHWFGLYHTFQDGCSGVNASTCGNSGDEVCDTPPVQSSTFNCPTSSKNSCTENPDVMDMYMNYMDYVYDNCMNLFTLGQKNRMWQMINQYRTEILTSKGAKDPVVISDNISLIKFTNLNNGQGCIGIYSPYILVHNIGTNNLNKVSLQMMVNNTSQIFNWTGSLSTNQGMELQLPTADLALGNNTISIKVLSVNDNLDTDTTSNVLSADFVYLEPIDQPLEEDFESLPRFTGDWTTVNPDNGITWERSNLAASHGIQSLFINNTEYSGGNGQIDDLLSPPIKLGANPQLKFKYAYKLFTELGSDFRDFSDTLRIFFDESCANGSTTMLFEGYGKDFTTGTPYFLESMFVPTASEWREVSLTVPSKLVGKTGRLVLRNITDNENSLFIDELNLSFDPAATADGQHTSAINIIPSRTSDFLSVKNGTNTQLEIFDIMGKKVFETNIYNNQQEVNISQLPAHIYIAKVKTLKEELTFKIIKE